jgi:hypothetical protein
LKKIRRWLNQHEIKPSRRAVDQWINLSTFYPLSIVGCSAYYFWRRNA